MQVNLWTCKVHIPKHQGLSENIYWKKNGCWVQNCAITLTLPWENCYKRHYPNNGGICCLQGGNESFGAGQELQLNHQNDSIMFNSSPSDLCSARTLYQKVTVFSWKQHGLKPNFLMSLCLLYSFNPIVLVQTTHSTGLLSPAPFSASVLTTYQALCFPVTLTKFMMSIQTCLSNVWVIWWVCGHNSRLWY